MKTLSDSEVHRLVGAFASPLYVLDPAHVVRNLTRLQDGVRRHYPHVEITYSVKSNFLRAILKTVLEAGFRLEVVSEHELALGASMGATPQQLLVNGPGKPDSLLTATYERSIDTNLDSISELERAAAIGTTSKPFRAGLRVAPVLRNGNRSRFGVDLTIDENLVAVRRVLATGRVDIAGFHVHHSSERSSASFLDRLKLLIDAAQRIDIEPGYLDIGGGVPSEIPHEIAATLPYETESPEQFSDRLGAGIAQVLGDRQTRIILEPGIGVLADSMVYLTRVVDVKINAERTDVIVDGSIFDINPLRSTVGPPCRLVVGAAPPNQPSEAVHSYPVFGSTCMEIDEIGTVTAPSAPRQDDVVVVSNVGAYSNVMSPEFIITQAAVYSLADEALVRDRQQLGNYTRAGLDVY